MFEVSKGQDASRMFQADRDATLVQHVRVLLAEQVLFSVIILWQKHQPQHTTYHSCRGRKADVAWCGYAKGPSQAHVKENTWQLKLESVQPCSTWKKNNTWKMETQRVNEVRSICSIWSLAKSRLQRAERGVKRMQGAPRDHMSTAGPGGAIF